MGVRCGECRSATVADFMFGGVGGGVRLAGNSPVEGIGAPLSGENLARVDVLFQFAAPLPAAPDLLDELIIVAPQAEVQLAEEYAEGWPELTLRVVGEAEHFEAFDRFTRPWQLRPWQRQQIVKLNAPALTVADYVLTLDPDVVALRADSAERDASRRPRTSSARASRGARSVVARCR